MFSNHKIKYVIHTYKYADIYQLIAIYKRITSDNWTFLNKYQRFVIINDGF